MAPRIFALVSLIIAFIIGKHVVKLIKEHTTCGRFSRIVAQHHQEVPSASLMQTDSLDAVGPRIPRQWGGPG